MSPSAQRPDLAVLFGLLADAVAERVVVRLQAAQADQLVRLDETGIERRAVTRLVAEGRLPVTKIGRVRYTSRRALAELVPSSKPRPDLAADDLGASLQELRELGRQTGKAGRGA
jgi:hypothetical protein